MSIATSSPAGGPERGEVPSQRARVVSYVALLVLGLVVGLAGSLLQAAWFPLGLLLALAATAGLFWGGAELVHTRGGAVAPAAGWVVAVIYLLLARPQGDFVYGAGSGTYVFWLGGLLAAVVSVTLAQPLLPVTTGMRR